MTAGRFKSRSWRRIKVRTPKRTIVRYTRKKPKKAVCALCKKEIHGVPREFPKKLKSMAKTKKRPERPYGGYLCSECLRKVMKEKARNSSFNK
ncbi:MAG: 50S ribosomal protein L34e [Candidatus Woesearchaeota archaeon]